MPLEYLDDKLVITPSEKGISFQTKMYNAFGIAGAGIYGAGLLSERWADDLNNSPVWTIAYSLTSLVPFALGLRGAINTYKEKDTTIILDKNLKKITYVRGNKEKKEKTIFYDYIADVQIIDFKNNLSGIIITGKTIGGGHLENLLSTIQENPEEIRKEILK